MNYVNRRIIAMLVKDVYDTPIYMPHCILQADQYLEYIDAVRCIIGEHTVSVPFKNLRDMNVQLPQNI